MSIKIIQIDHNSKYLNDVIALGDANKSTLGLFPKEAYKESASKKWVIVAIDESKGNVAGYLLYHVSRRKMLVYIVHLCVDISYRGKGIAKTLFNELCLLTKKGYKAIRVHCRIDYEANHVWPKLGFTAVNEIPGRSKNGRTILRVWWFDYGHPSLFSYVEEFEMSSKTKITIDANIFFQLQHTESRENEESLALLEPWLDIELYVTPEIFNEITRNPNPAERDAARKFANTFKIISGTDDKFQDIEKSLLPLLPKPKKPSDDSDRRQLARTISAGLPFFVTRDEDLVTRSDDVFEKFGVQIVRPADIILMQDEVLRGSEYSPTRMAGSKIHVEKIHSQQSSSLVEKFLMSQYETKNQFNKKLQILLSKPKNFEAFVVKDFQEDLGLIVYGRENSNELSIPVFRILQKPISSIIARYLINNAIAYSFADRYLVIKIDNNLSDLVATAVGEAGFFRDGNHWAKIAIYDVLNKQALTDCLSESLWPEYVKDLVNELMLLLIKIIESDTPILLDIEKTLWPLKIKDLDIPSYIVPIRPEWAMHLFDADIASQDLFGGEPSLILNTENVYYRSSAPKILSAPGRILWYVSSGDNRYQGSMRIKACSYLDYVEIGKPKQLFSKHRKLGIYKWQDVYNGVAKGDPNKDIMAFKFSRTEIFTKSIHFNQLQEIWKAQGQNFNPIAPILIDKERFFNLYELGMKGQNDGK